MWMKLFKRINQFSGVFAVLFFIVMVILVRRRILGSPYYIIGGLFLMFAAVFIVTACAYILQSVVWHIKNKKLGALVRHYAYAYMAIYVLLMILDHITMGSVSWVHNLHYALIAAMIQVYLHGYHLEFSPEKTDAQIDE